MKEESKLSFNVEVMTRRYTQEVRQSIVEDICARVLVGFEDVPTINCDPRIGEIKTAVVDYNTMERGTLFEFGVILTTTWSVEMLKFEVVDNLTEGKNIHDRVEKGFKDEYLVSVMVFEEELEPIR